MNIYTNKRCAFLFLFLAASAVLFSGCTTPPSPDGGDDGFIDWPAVPGDSGTNATNQTQGGEKLLPCSDSPNVLAKDACLVQAAKNTKNSTLCSLIYTLDKKDACLLNFEDGTSAFCQKYTSALLKDECYYNIAKATKSIDDCNLIGSSEKRQECIQLLLPTCEQKNTLYERDLCKAFKEGDSSLCPDEACVFDLAKNRTNDDLCDAINASANRLACKSYVLDYDKCLLEANKVIRDLCYQIWGQKADSPSICGKASVDYNYGNLCYLNLSITRKDYSICKYSTSEEKDNDCYTEYAKVHNTLRPCDAILSETVKNKCLNEVASKYGTASYCNNITTYAWRTTCFSGIIVGGGALKLDDCNAIAYSEWQERCWNTLAYQKQDKEICMLLSDPDDRKECSDQIG